MDRACAWFTATRKEALDNPIQRDATEIFVACPCLLLQPSRLNWLIQWTTSMPGIVPITVVETPEFLSAARELMTEQERAVLVDYLAHNPTAGDLIQGAKNERADLRQKDRNAFRQLTKLLAETYGRRRDEQGR
jgi:hypothetical protein